MKFLNPRGGVPLVFSSRSHCIINPILLLQQEVVVVEIIHQNGLPISTSSSRYSTYYPPSPRRHHEEESRNVKVSVWWDFENCTLPCGANVFKVAHSITAAVRGNGIKGPIQITAFGDVLQLSRSNQQALSSTGINITHIPHGGKNSADRSLLVDLMYWVSQNPPPAHLFLISGDRDFASILHRLRMNNYNILLSSPESAPGVLCSAASIMWHWNALAKGQNLTGKHFNQPPDGPYGSWYGNYKLPLEDPFAVPAPACEELSESSSEPKLRPVPKAVIRQIRHIMNSYPHGISITDLRTELDKSNVSIDKDLYGHRKFSRFILSMPHILKLQSEGEGHLFVPSVGLKISDPVENKGESNLTVTTKLNGKQTQGSTISKGVARVDEKSSILPPLPKPIVEEPQTKMQEPQTIVQEPIPLVEKENNVSINESHLRQNSKSQVGFFKTIWRKWLGSKNDDFEKNYSIGEESTAPGGNTEKTDNEGKYVEATRKRQWLGSKHGDFDKNYSIGEECTAPGGNTVKTDKEEKHVEATRKSDSTVSMASSSSSFNGAALENKVAEGSKAYGDNSSGDRGFFNLFMSWCKFWWRDPNSDILGEQSSEELNQIIVDSGNNKIFSKDSFWEDMEAFVNTPKCSVLVLQSRTREQLAKNLQKQGFSVLRSLSENDLLHLVNLLILEKKWVRECPSKTYPFKLIPSASKTSSLSNPRTSIGLRSIFLTETSQSSSERPQGNGEAINRNLQKPTGKSKNEILSDCQNLVDEIVKEYPEGFNMGSFRKLFQERCGYSLDLQKLGYQKLATLLQIMSGIKIESTFVIPATEVSKSFDLETADLDVQGDDVIGSVANSDSESSDSPWEELGPVSVTNPNRNEMELRLRRKVKEETTGQRNHDYETLLDDEISDYEEETSPLKGLEGQANARMSGEDSSLLQILDSWYSSKEGSEGKDGFVDCSRNDSKPSGVGIKTGTSVVKCGRKQKSIRSYSFVSDQLGDNKDKLIDGILGSLKKSGESWRQS